MEIFNTILYQPILQSLLFLQDLTGSLGIAIIILTLGIRLVLLPLTMPSMKATAKIKEIQPELDKLKKKFANDKAKLQQAQLELFQKYQINPVAGCLPYILQFVVLIALYRVFIDFLGGNQDGLSTTFLWFNLKTPDSLYLLPLIAAFTQFILGLMIVPASDTSAEKAIAAQTKTKKDDEKAEDMTQMAQTMQQQMMYVMPIMIGFLALRFPAGLALYWIVSMVFSIGQQYAVSGLGGLTKYLPKSSRQ